MFRAVIILFVLATCAFAQVAPPVLSEPHGYKAAPFSLSVSGIGELRYTLDGSAPSPTNGTVYLAPFTVSTTSVVRVAAVVAGAASPVVTRTYLFPADIVAQSGTPPGWPAVLGNNHVTDYGMDPRVVSANAATIQSDLLTLPAMCLTFAVDDFFSDDGIYTNPSLHGEAWERAMNLELVQPGAPGGGGFSQPGSVRIRGGFSRDAANPKHAFHFYFRDSSGGKLKFPLFGGGVSTFERLDLRCATDWSWSFLGSPDCDFIRELWCRDTLGRLGQPTARGHFYHLFLNGQYWGLYCSQERISGDFAARALGGREGDYDVVKPETTSNYTISAADGDLRAWRRLWDAANTGFTGNSAYFKVQGRSADGGPNPALENLVDVDSLIAYMLVIFYSGDEDAPITASVSDGPNRPNSGINNFFCVRDRTGADGFRFFGHDGEVTFVSADVDRTGPFIAGDPKRGSTFARSNPQYLFQQLAKNAEFRVRFADAVERACFHGGPLSPGAAAAAFSARMAEIDRAVILESARWGDAKRQPAQEPLGRAEWLAACQSRFLDGFFPTRVDYLVAQFRARGWFPRVDAPVASQRGGAFGPGAALTLTGGGAIYYTRDGSDPRLIGGGVSPAAVRYSAPVSLTSSVRVRARVLAGGVWSAAADLEFWPSAQSFAGLRVSELHYDPLPFGDVDGDNYEFIELHNSGGTALDLGGCRFTSGISFAFPPGTMLSAGSRLVLAADRDRFVERYPDVKAFGFFNGNFADGGEMVTLADPAGAPLVSFIYDDAVPWPVEAAKLGRSLVFTGGAPAVAANWRASTADHGSPFPREEVATGVSFHGGTQEIIRGEPLAVPLGVAGFDSVSGWEVLSPLPPGFILGADGVLRGAATAAGNFTARIRISGVREAAPFSFEQDFPMTISAVSTERMPPVARIGLPGEALPEERALAAGNASDASGIERVEVSLDGGAFSAANVRAVSAKKANWSHRFKNLAPGKHTVRVRALDRAGNWSAPVARSFRYVVERPLEIAISGEGTLPNGWAGTTLRELSRSYTVTAKPAPGKLFAGWLTGAGAPVAETETLTFTMSEGLRLVAFFVDNRFPAAATHRGLLEAGAPSHASRGVVSIARTKMGAFTAALTLGGATHRFSGRLNPASGEFSALLPRPGAAPLPVAFVFNFGPRNISVTAGTAAGVARPPFYHGKTNPFSAAGIFPFSFPPLAAPAPQVAGFGKLTASSAGALVLAGRLADGAAFSCAANLDEFDNGAFYQALYNKGGSLSGVLRFDDADHARGNMLWSKPGAFEGQSFCEAAR